MIKTKLKPTREGYVHSVEIDDHKLYIRTGEYDDGTLGELFIALDKEGTELRVYDAVAIAISIGLQYGVPQREIDTGLFGEVAATEIFRREVMSAGNENTLFMRTTSWQASCRHNLDFGEAYNHETNSSNQTSRVVASTFRLVAYCAVVNVG